MWGTVAVLVEFGCIVMMLINLARAAGAHQRAGTGMFKTPSPLLEVPKAVRRSLLRTIRRGEPVPAEHADLARRWAGYETGRRWMAWNDAMMVLLFAVGLPITVRGPGALEVAGFWLSLVGACGVAVVDVFLWWDQRAASRLLRSAAQPA